MSVKIQINSLEALERLIGGDNELEVELRTSIVQNFTNRHLKNIANEEIVKGASQAITRQLESMFFDITDGYYKKYELKDTARNKIKEVAEMTVNRIIREYVENMMEEFIYSRFRKHLEDSAEWITDQIKEKMVEDKLDKLVTQKIKEKLNL